MVAHMTKMMEILFLSRLKKLNSEVFLNIPQKYKKPKWWIKVKKPYINLFCTFQNLLKIYIYIYIFTKKT